MKVGPKFCPFLYYHSDDRRVNNSLQFIKHNCLNVENNLLHMRINQHILYTESYYPLSQLCKLNLFENRKIDD